ncbi:MAG: Arm DNA-binding domain-containing protein [Aeromonas sp.]
MDVRKVTTLSADLIAAIQAAPGVELHGSKLRISFHYHRQRCRETFNIPVTKTNLKYVIRQREAILHEIALGTFDYIKYFPNSRKALTILARSQTITAISMGELAERYLRAREVDLSTASLRNYHATLRVFLKETGYSQLACDFRQENLQHWRASMIKRTSSQTGRRLAPRSVNYRVGVVSALLKWAGKNGYCDPTLCQDSLDTLVVARERPDPFTQAEAAALIDCARTEQERLWITLALWTGMRGGELCALAWEDIDLATGKLTVRRNISIEHSYKLPKTGRTRELLLLPPALGALRALHRLTGHLPAERITKTTHNQAEEIENCRFALINPVNGGGFAVNTTLARWIRIAKRAGIRYRSQYHTRHTFASRMLTAGANPEWVAAYLGHADSKMLRTVYGAWMPEQDRSEVDRVWQQISEQFY